MPDYEYECPTHGIFEETHSIKIKLEFCPKCKEEDGKEQSIKRLISLGGRGVVQLEGDDLVKSVKDSANKIKRAAARNENTYANLLGDGKYQQLQTAYDKNKR